VWFLEMNTRLQVEHPVTECVYGVDLVALQLAVAEGRPLSGFVSATSGSSRGAIADESGWAPRGHAVEVRLYAEVPAAGGQPQSGRLTRFDIPGIAAELEVPASYGVRLDSGFVAGDEVGTHYDAMLAKVIAWAPTREEALRRLAGTLAKARIHGLRTNRDLLVNVLRHEAVVAGEVSTDFFARHGLDELSTPAADDDAVALSAFAATVACAERDKAARTVQPRIPVGWRNVVSAPQLTRFVCESPPQKSPYPADESGWVDVHWYGGRDGYTSADRDARVVEAAADRVVLEHDGMRRTFEVLVDDDGAVDVESSLGHVALRRAPRFVDPADQVATGSLLAPMPGTVVSVAVAVGDRVAAGAPVLVLEAMKMQHTVSAPHDGVVAELSVSTGAQVAAGDVLAVVTAESAAEQGETP
jgi:propionyl-CoA carboxylase alpha chain